MFITQTYHDLGSPPNYTLLGIYFDDFEMHDSQGFGVAYETLVQNAIKRFEERHISPLAKEHALAIAKVKSESVTRKVLNVKLEFRAGSSHPSYHVVALRVTGDLYQERFQCW